jgi:predicted Zn-dependent peptidase
LYQLTRLDNGLRVIATHLPHARSVSATFFVSGGSRNESAKIQGASHFLEHMLFKGTERRPTSKAIAEAIEGVGGYYNAEAGKELTVYWGKVAERHWKVTVDVLADLLRHSLFEDVEIEKERRVIAEELGMLVDSPGEWVHLLSDEAMWGDQPLGRDVGGTRDSVMALDRGTLIDWFSRQYVPSSIVVSVAGPIQPEIVLDEVARQLGDWSGPVAPAPEPARAGPTARVRLKSKRTEQAHFCIALPALSYVDPDRYALDVLNIILGDSSSSRLFSEIREKQGLAYDVHSYTNEYQDDGSLVVYAGVEPARVDQALRASLDEIARMTEPVAPDELARAKEIWKGRILLRLEDTQSMASWFGDQETLLGRIYSVDEVVEQVDALESADVQRAAHRVVVEDRLCIAVIGPYRSEDRFARQLHF